MASKRKRRRLARAELTMHLAQTAGRWASELRQVGARPFDQWGDNDPMVMVSNTYQLGPEDLARICDRLADELERAADRRGYGEELT